MGEEGERPRGTPLRGKGLRGWVPASARTTEGDGRFANRPYGGWGWGKLWGEEGGRPRGTPLRGKGMGPRILEDNGGGRAVREPPLRGMGEGDGSPHPRGQRRGTGGSRTARTGDGERGRRRGGKGSGFVVIEGPRWYSAFLKWEEYVRLSYTHFPQRRRFISD